MDVTGFARTDVASTSARFCMLPGIPRAHLLGYFSRVWVKGGCVIRPSAIERARVVSAVHSIRASQIPSAVYSASWQEYLSSCSRMLD